MKHEELKDLILVFEDLKGDEKVLAETHLSECEPCRNLLAALRSAEKLDPGLRGLPASPSNGPVSLEHLSEEELRAAEFSRQKLLENIGNHSAQTVPGSQDSGWWRHNSGLLGLALAAGLALVIWMPWQHDPQEFVQDFRLTTPAVVRGAASDLKTGEAFVIRFQMGQGGWPVVIRLLDAGPPLLVFPESEKQAVKLSAGRTAVLPPPGSGTDWEIDSDIDRTVYLISISENELPDLGQLKILLGEAAEAKDITAATSRLLVNEFGNCNVFDDLTD